MSKIRVLMIIDRFDVNGTTTHVLSTMKQLKENGIHAVVAGIKSALIYSFRDSELTAYELNHTENKRNFNKRNQQLEEIIENEEINIIHSHQISSGYDAAICAKENNIPFIFTAHGTYYHENEYRKIIALSDQVICVSPPVCDYIKRLSPKKMHMISNGIDLNEFTPSNSEHIREYLGLSEKDQVIIYVGRLAWKKAQICHFLMKAVKELKLKNFPNLKLIIIGDGKRSREIKTLAKNINHQCKDQCIHVIGEKLNIGDYYSIANCVVGTGRSALEALACGKDVIAAGNDGYFGRVTIDNWQAAWNCYFGDHSSNKSNSTYFLNKDLKQFLNEKSMPGRDRSELRDIVNSHFNSIQTTKSLITVYEGLLKNET